MKSLLYRLLARTPGGAQLHHWAQRHITRQFPRPSGAYDEFHVGADRFFVDVQNPVVLGEHDAPQPDLVLL